MTYFSISQKKEIQKNRHKGCSTYDSTNSNKKA